MRWRGAQLWFGGCAVYDGDDDGVPRGPRHGGAPEAPSLGGHRGDRGLCEVAPPLMRAQGRWRYCGADVDDYHC